MTVPFLMPKLALGASIGHGGDVRANLPRLAAALSAALDTPVRSALADSYDELLALLGQGKIQIAWLPPLMHARAIEAGARLAAVPQRGGWLTYRAAILVHRDRPVVGISRLRGLRAAWVDKASSSGYLFPRLELAMLGAPPERIFTSETFYGSASLAARAVGLGEADLCACFVTDSAARNPERAAEDVQRALGEAAQKLLRILHVTEPIPPDGFVLAAQLSALEQTRVTAALLALHEREPVRQILLGMLRAEKLVAVNDALLRSLRSWVDAAASRG